jgi:hypothetical protein
MKKRSEMPKEIFDALFDGAIEDLRRSGVDNEEILPIINEIFGVVYARKYFPKGLVQHPAEKPAKDERKDVSSNHQ